MDHHRKYFLPVQLRVYRHFHRPGHWPVRCPAAQEKRRRAQSIPVPGRRLYAHLLGFIQRENMQIEGFFFYLLSGLFAGSVIHYLIAKVFGPLIFNRGWCGWACWTAAVLDLLPYNKKTSGRHPKLGQLRFIHFFASLVLVLILWFVFNYGRERSPIMSSTGCWRAMPSTFSLPLPWPLALKTIEPFANTSALFPPYKKLPRASRCSRSAARLKNVQTAAPAYAPVQWIFVFQTTSRTVSGYSLQNVSSALNVSMPAHIKSWTHRLPSISPGRTIFTTSDKQEQNERTPTRYLAGVLSLLNQFFKQPHHPAVVSRLPMRAAAPSSG